MFMVVLSEQMKNGNICIDWQLTVIYLTARPIGKRASDGLVLDHRFAALMNRAKEDSPFCLAC